VAFLFQRFLLLNFRFHYLILFCVISLSFFVGILFSFYHNNFIDFSVLENYHHSKPSILLDDKGNEWARFELDKRESIKFNEIPKHLINAFIASEDRDFFNHSGISYKGIIRSILVNFKNRRIVQGASTITQQLVKLIFFDSKKTFKRKVKEQIFALLVEQQFSKEQIFETYLNHIYFGCGIYGIQAASQRFFSKPVNEINIEESALLAGIVKSPLNYCPLISAENSKKRRNLILKLMHQLDFISLEELEKSLNADLNIIKCKSDDFAPHLKETIRIYLENELGKKLLYTGGLKIQTTINKHIQQIAQNQFNQHLVKLKDELKMNVDGALMTLDVKTGEIKAVIGGYDFFNSKFNRAFQAKRQMGSIFKPIVYSAAIQNGMNFSQIDIDEPFELITNGTIWRPQNNTGTFKGPMTLAKALSCSNNIITIKTLLNVGCKNVANLAKKFKFSSPILAYPALALGCVDATLKESSGAFNVFANNGIYVEPHFIKWIKNDLGKKIYKNDIVPEQIIESNVSSQVAKVLSIGMKRYFSKMSNPTLKVEAIGKTGTTNDCRTSWFCGSTPELTTAIYIGCDNNQPMGKNIYGVKTAFPIWLGLNEKIDFKHAKFDFDSNLKEITINWNTGEICNYYHPEAVSILVN